MELTRNVHQDHVKRAIIAGILTTSRTLGIRVIAEGIEQPGEFHALRELGVSIFQGYLFARPGHRSLPSVSDEGRALLATASSRSP